MDFTEYRQRGKEMVDYIADYLENIRDRRVFPDVKPGYMKNLLPDSAPLEGEQWETIFSDVERVIMPGITHWQSPHMHAYFPALNSFPSLLGDMLADAINCLGFTWASSPACTELEIIVMNWLGKMINLPDDFLHLSSLSRGGGVVQTTASEATLVCLLAGRTRAIQRFHEKRPGYQDAEINARLVAYCSDQAHSSVEKAALIGLVRMRYIEADENLSMRGQLLREAIEDDIRQGLVPFWVCATLGTTGSCSFDNLEEIGIVCREKNLWLHVDAAYAGSAFICPEFRTWLKGIERADSIAFNPSKWLMIHFDATALWVKDSTAVHRTFNVEPLYLQHENSGVAVDFMHWQIPLSRRFRALKMWFVIRSFGIKGLQRHIREGVRLAQKFEALVLADHRFEIPAKRHLGLVVFRIKGDNEITERLLKRLNHRGNLHCIPSSLKGKYVIRFTVTSTRTTVDDILSDWVEIKSSATAILDEMNITISNRVYLKDTKEKCEGFGSSLLLSNSPLSPKIVNGSFAALFDADEFLAKTYAGIRIAHQESPSMRRRVRGILMSGKQFSLDSHMDVVVQTSMKSNTTNSKGVDCYGKTSANVRSDERDAICEDEESLEDCEMNWILNTALLLNPRNYLAIFNNQKIPPIDIIQHQNNLSVLKKYSTNYDINNFTKSVNSVRTPLTQYQLYKCPRPPSHIKQNRTDQLADSSDLYPGKRYLNLDLTLHNDSIFTDTIFNLPTPTEEVIPIIITAETPTTTTKSIQEIEDFNKLQPPRSNLIPTVTTAPDIHGLEKILSPKPTISMASSGRNSKKFESQITTIAKRTFPNVSQDITKVTVTETNTALSETALNSPKSKFEDYYSVLKELIQSPKPSTIVEDSAESDIEPNIDTLDTLVSIESKNQCFNTDIQSQQPWTTVGNSSLFENGGKENFTQPEYPTSLGNSAVFSSFHVPPSVPSSVLVDNHSIFKESKSQSEDYLNLKKLSTEDSVQSNTSTQKSLSSAEDFEVFKESNTKSNLQPSLSTVLVDNYLVLQESKTDSDSENSLIFKEVESKSNLPIKVFAAKSVTSIDDVYMEANCGSYNQLSKASSSVADFSNSKVLESNIQSPGSSSRVQEISAKLINRKSNNQLKLFTNSKSKDDSSSPDKFIEAVRQPSTDSEGSSTVLSSLELM